MEVNAAHGPVVFIEPIDESSHAVVPQLDHTRMQRGEDPWALGVERQALDAVRLGLCAWSAATTNEKRREGVWGNDVWRQRDYWGFFRSQRRAIKRSYSARPDIGTENTH